MFNGCIKTTSNVLKIITTRPKQLFAFRVPFGEKIVTRSLTCSCPSQQRLKEDETRFNGVRIQLGVEDTWTNEEFENELISSSQKWKKKNRRSVFLEVPIQLGHLISVASKYGFTFHHARNDVAVLCKWLVEDSESKIPSFANHQVGVAGACFREDTEELLVVQDKGRFSNWWKCPGGFSNIGEFIGDTAIREVYEETGVETEFRSILFLRQQHDVFYGQSDLYFICRLHPLTYDLHPCPEEIERCEWMKIDKILAMKDSTPFVKMICKMLLQGNSRGFDTVDMNGYEQESWVVKNKMMWLFHRPIA